MSPRKLNRDMRIHNLDVRRAVKIGVDPDSPLIKRNISPEVIKELDAERKKTLGNSSATTAQKALLERYNADPKNSPVNTIDELIDDNIFKVRRAIQNMIDYGDARVFKLLPSEVIKEIEIYGMAAQENYKAMLSRMGDNRVYVVPEHYRQCRRCGKYKKPKKFMTSVSDMHDGRMPICTECANELFRQYMRKYKDVREVLVIMSHKLDLYVYGPNLDRYVKLFDTTEGKELFLQNQFFTRYVVDLYIQKHFNKDLASLMFENTKLEGVPFKCANPHVAVPQIYNDKFIVEVVTEKEIDRVGVEITQDDVPLSQATVKKLQYKFGEYSPQDLKWLERKYREWDEEYDISELNKRKLIVQMCCDELLIVRGRERGEDMSKQWKSYVETMKTLALTPKQREKTATSNGFSSFSDLVKECEKHGPVVERSPEFKDVDGINRFMVAIAGAIGKTLGKKNEYTEAFDQIYSEYSSSLLDIDMGDSDAED